MNTRHTMETSSIHSPSRRDFLRLGSTAALGLVGAGFLAACGSNDTAGTTGTSGTSGTTAGGSQPGSASGTDFGTVNMQLGWIKNMQFCGEYMAKENGYYADNGLSVNLVSGGAAATSTEAAISTSKAWTGTSKPLTCAEARSKGAKVKIIGAVMQDGGHVIMSPADSPLKTPHDLIGKKVGVPSHTQPDFLALLAANDIDPDDVDIVTVQFDPTPLVNGEVDAWDGYANNEPIVLAQKGFDTSSFSYGDYGLPTVAQVLEVSEESLANERDKVKAFLNAEIRGWKDAIADPEQAVKYCVNKYGKELKLDLDTQMATFKATIDLITNDWTKKHGLMTMSDSSMANTVASIKASGTTTTPDELFDFSILNEIYDDNPDLV